MDLPQQRTNTAVHAAPGQQVYVTVDTGGHMASPAQVYFDQVSLKKNWTLLLIFSDVNVNGINVYRTSQFKNMSLLL